MPLDAVCISALVNELREKLCDLRVDKVQQPERDMLLLSLRGREKGKLVLSAGSSPRIHLTNSSYENPASPPMFCMLLRKHITGARIAEINQPELERMVEIVFDAVDAMGEACRKRLIIELIGRNSNIILVDGDGYIIDCFRRVDFEKSELRQVLPGLIYKIPPKQNKLLPGEAVSNLPELLDNAPSERALEKWLLDTFVGISPLVARELSVLAYGDVDFRIERAREKDGYAAFVNVFREFCSSIDSKSFTPYILSDAENTPKDFSYLPITQYGRVFACERQESFSDMLDAFYTRRDKAERVRQRSQSLYKAVRNLRDRTERKLASQRQELLAAEKREPLRENGDLIMANIHLIKRGDKTLIADDFYSENGGKREIKLDERKNAQQNAAAYYKSYAKAKNAEKHLTEYILQGEEELEYLNSVLEAIEKCEGENDIEEIRQELTDIGYLKKQRPKNGKREKRIEQQPMHFVSTSGFDILVGKNNAQNDKLTLKTAMRYDMWLHTQKIHGSHAIISLAGRELDDETLHEAAVIAAYYSKARQGENVPVDYTLVRYVKKPSGAKPGMVIYTDYKTVYVTPDENLVNRLRK